MNENQIEDATIISEEPIEETLTEEQQKAIQDELEELGFKVFSQTNEGWAILRELRKETAELITLTRGPIKESFDLEKHVDEVYDEESAKRVRLVFAATRNRAAEIMKQFSDLMLENKLEGNSVPTPEEANALYDLAGKYNDVSYDAKVFAEHQIADLVIACTEIKAAINSEVKEEVSDEHK